MHRNILSASLLAALALAGCGARNAASADPASASDAAAGAQDDLTDWPHVVRAIPADPAIDARVREIVAGMQLAQNVEPCPPSDTNSVKPEQHRECHSRSVTHGGGS